ncbi:plasmid stabilization protein StbA [Klebsiella pneumoniae]|uniref:plasmid stabilization protein StbA n=1 Tax=Klebsiella pneumoniae TaxID=573 RepID=UPI0034D703E1
MPAFEWVHVQLHQQKGMISLSPPTICNSALYRTRQNRKNVLHNTHDKSSAKGAAESVLHNTQPSEPEAQESEKAESPGIIDKEFFNKIGENFDPKKFNKKF